MSYPYTQTPMGNVMPPCRLSRSRLFHYRHTPPDQSGPVPGRRTRNVFMVADGMGGNSAGEQAAQMAITAPYHPTLLGCEHADGETIRQLICEAFLDVNQEIAAAASLDSQLYGMGTTAVLALLVQDRLYIASLGDSRAYLLRDGDLHQYTVDHNMAQTLVSMGALSREDARQHRWRNMLWKYVGAPDLKEGPDVAAIRLQPQDRILLVTDGVTEILTNREMVTILQSHQSAQDAAEALTRAAVSRGTRDDVTSVVLNISWAIVA